MEKFLIIKYEALNLTLKVTKTHATVTISR